MHLSHCPLPPVEGDVRLRDNGLQPVLFEFMLTERPREEAATILLSVQVDNERTAQLSLGEDQKFLLILEEEYTLARSPGRA